MTQKVNSKIPSFWKYPGKWKWQWQYTERYDNQRYDSPDSTTCRTEKSKQNTIKGMFGNTRKKVDQVVAKYIFFNTIPMYTTKGPYRPENVRK